MLKVMTDQEAVRFLLRAQFSAPDDDITSVKTLGYDGWLSQAFDRPPGQRGFDWLDQAGHNAVTAEAKYFWPMAGDFMAWNQLLSRPDQFRVRAAFALSQFFVVSLNPIDGFWPPYVMAAYWDMLSDSAFGNFRTLLERVTLNAGMGMYLNAKGNLKEDDKTGRRPDENYAREIMQLFTIGLYALNPDGSDRTDADGARIETYKQRDVSNLARVFTGYDFDMAHVARTRVSWQDYPVLGTQFCANPMKLEPAKHSMLAVAFLGTRIPANTPGPDALRITLDALFAHPNVGPFFGRQMIQRLVTSNPSPAYVGRVSAAFADNGQGVRGDLQAVWRAVLTDPEALAPVDPSNARFAKLRERVVRYVGWARTVGQKTDTGAYEIYDQTRADEGLGQSPLRSPSVFNYYRPGYIPPHTAMSASETQAPEFQLETETSVAGYINWMREATLWGRGDVKPTYEALLPIAHDVPAVVDWLNLRLTAGQVSEESCAIICGALTDLGVTAASSTEDKVHLLANASLLMVVTPEYLVQK